MARILLTDELGEQFTIETNTGDHDEGVTPAGEAWHRVGPPTNLPGERWDNEQGETAWRDGNDERSASTRTREARSERPTYMIPHLYPGMLFCSVCGTPTEGCEGRNPGECEVCDEAAELIGDSGVCAGCFVPRDHGDPSE